MSQLDLLILIVYTLATLYILYRAIESADQKTRVTFEDKTFRAALEKHNLGDRLNIKFKFDKRYGIDDQPKQLTIVIENKSEDVFYVDWDRSSLTDQDGRARRMVRLTPYKSPDLSHTQAFSIVPPGQSLQENIAAEDGLAPDADNQQLLVPTKPLLNLAGIKAAGKKSKAKKKLYEDFMEGKQHFSFQLWIVLQMGTTDSALRGDRTYCLPCDIKTVKVPWTDSLPWQSSTGDFR